MDTEVEFSRLEFDEPERHEDDTPGLTVKEFCAREGLERVVVSPPVEGSISIWDGHRRRTWTAHDGDALSDALGRRTLAFRTSHEQAQHHYIGLRRDSEGLVVIVPEYYYESPPWSGRPGYGFTTVEVHGRFADHDGTSPATDTQWKSFAWFLVGQFEQAAARGDRLDIAAADSTCHTELIVSARIGFDGRCHIETWHAGDNDEGPDTTTHIGATRHTLHDIGRVLANSTRERVASPLQTLLTLSTRQGPRATLS
jgi:hypothetical protein